MKRAEDFTIDQYIPLSQGVVIRLPKHDGKIELSKKAQMESMDEKDLVVKVLKVADDVTEIKPGDGVYIPFTPANMANAVLPFVHIEKKENGEEVVYDTAQFRVGFVLGVVKGMFLPKIDD